MTKNTVHIVKFVAYIFMFQDELLLKQAETVSHVMILNPSVNFIVYHCGCISADALQKKKFFSKTMN